MTTVEQTQLEIDRLIRTIDRELSQRGVLLISKAQDLRTAAKRALHEMTLSECVTPADFFNPKWRQQARTLQQFEIRLQRIIRGVRVPTNDHENESPNNEQCR